MLTRAELTTLERLAYEQDTPLGTAAYRIVARSLKRRK